MSRESSWNIPHSSSHLSDPIPFQVQPSSDAPPQYQTLLLSITFTLGLLLHMYEASSTVETVSSPGNGLRYHIILRVSNGRCVFGLIMVDFRGNAYWPSHPWWTKLLVSNHMRWSITFQVLFARGFSTKKLDGGEHGREVYSWLPLGQWLDGQRGREVELDHDSVVDLGNYLKCKSCLVICNSVHGKHLAQQEWCPR